MERLLIENLATIAAVTLLLGSLALGPIGRAIARRIEGSPRGGVDLERRLLDLERTRQQVLELEERVDFAERMLARQDGRLALEPGSE